MIDEHEISKFFNVLGLALFNAQALEFSSVTLITINQILVEPNFSKKRKKFMNQKYKLTLGKLINEIKKINQIEPSLMENLVEALSLRNWFIHNFFREFGAAGKNATFTAIATNKVYEIALKFEKVNDKIQALCFDLMIQTGKTEAGIKKDIDYAIDCYIESKLNSELNSNSAEDEEMPITQLSPPDGGA